MAIGDDGVASICMGKAHVGNPCERCGHVKEETLADTAVRIVRYCESTTTPFEAKVGYVAGALQIERQRKTNQ